MLLRLKRRMLSSFVTPSSLGLTSEQLQIQALAKQFADDHLAPNMQKWDEEGHFPMDVIRKSADLGFSGKHCASFNVYSMKCRYLYKTRCWRKWDVTLGCFHNI